MSLTFRLIANFSIIAGALIGLIRFRKIDRKWFPFVFLMWLGLINEIVNRALIANGFSNAVNTNIYCLFESLIVLWLFKECELFENNKKLFYFIGSSFIIGWFFVNTVLFPINRFNSYYNIFYSFAIVLMSIQMINQLIVSNQQQLFKNPIFLISLGFIVFFTYLVLIEIFWLYGLNRSRSFRNNIYRILIYINLAVNLIYAVATLWIPKKREYTLL
jgi:hypothetical protein